MLELAAADCSIISCHSRPEILDRLAVPAGGVACRVAPNELMVVGAGPDGPEMARVLQQELQQADAHSLVVDQSDGWAVWVLSGPDRHQVPPRLCSTPLPGPGEFLQGEIGNVPAKALVLSDRFYLMTVAGLGHHLRRRIEAVSSDLGLISGPPVPFRVDRPLRDERVG